MPAGLWRHAVRGPRGRSTLPGNARDEGFTLVEVLVSIALMTIVMTALTTFFVATGSATSQQSGHPLVAVVKRSGEVPASAATFATAHHCSPADFSSNPSSSIRSCRVSL